ncbi:MAG: ROK family glucokinase [Planctomycetes bacterium]|nr:ROK family glucokinase [Planctomycetota bacterium]
MASHYIGIDLGGTNFRCGVIDENHQIVSKYETPTNAQEGSSAVIDKLVDGIERVLLTAEKLSDDIMGVGIGFPGPLNQERGLVFNAPNMPGWENVPLAEIIRERTGIRTFIENDANCAGWGEYVHGAGRGVQHMMMVTLGTGIGGAIIIGGKLHIGRDGAAGELGHVPIIDGGRRCGCGASGCVEAYASASSVVRRFRDMLDQGWSSSLRDRYDTLTSYDIFTAGAAGDPVALHIVEETGHYLGVMASAVAELLNPERCVVAGGMIQAGEILFGTIRRTCLNRNHHPGRTMEIVPAELGQNAGLIGAADTARVRLEAAP